MSSGIVALLMSGERAARTAAFTQLSALASRSSDVPSAERWAANDGQLLLPPPLQLKNLRGEIEEAALEGAMSQFGTVLAATVHKLGGGSEAWALVTFAEPAETDTATKSAPSSSATFGCTVACLQTAEVLGGVEHDMLCRHQARVRIKVATACVGPLLEVGAQLSDPGEFRRAMLLLAELYKLDEVAVGAEVFRDLGRLACAFAGGVHATLYDKDPAQLTRSDALTLSVPFGPNCLTWCHGSVPTLRAANVNIHEYIQELTPKAKMYFQAGGSPAVSERLALLMLELVCGSDAAVGEAELMCVWFALSIVLYGRVAQAMVLIEAGVLDAFLSVLQQGSPADWVTTTTPYGMLVGGAFHLGWALSTVDLPIDTTQLFIEKGVIDVSISALKAYELHGPTKVNEANVLTIWCALELLAQLDLTTPEAQSIVQKLAGIPTTLQFVLDHELVHFSELGYTTSATTARVCALAFGKEEEGSMFTFSQSLVDMFVRHNLSVFSGIMSSFNPVLKNHFLAGLNRLCVSDRNKELLVRCPDLVAVLTECLFLDPAHQRQAQEELVKAEIQLSAVECLLQIALFPPGRDMLKRQAATMDALHSLDNATATAFSKQAKASAHGAIVALEGRMREPEPETDSEQTMQPADKHVMMSYSWSHQRTVERIVRSLQKRGYLVWFDLDSMKGNTVDAMSDAIDNCVVFLYAVSLEYKESANCRLEANYAHQQELDMIPLMLQDGYRPKGWYSFSKAKDDDEATFEKRVDAVCREIGERGKPTEEGVPPTRAPVAAPSTPARAPAPAPAPAPGGATEPVPEPAPTSTWAPATPTSSTAQGYTPSAMMSMSAGSLTMMPTTAVSSLPTPPQGPLVPSTRATMSDAARAATATTTIASDGTNGGSIVEMAAMFKQMQQYMAPVVTEAVSPEQLLALQSRLESLHAAGLLADEELFAVEDIIQDFSDLRQSWLPHKITVEQANGATGNTFEPARALLRMVGASTTFASDKMFARQLRRKFVK